MKRNSFLALLLCALFLVVGTGCSSQNSGTQNGAAQKTTKSAQLANPVKTYDSLAKAEKAAGFKFTVPEGVNVNGADYAQYYWSTINNDLIEVRYGGEGDEVCYMRKAGVSKGDKAGEDSLNVFAKIKLTPRKGMSLDEALSHMVDLPVDFIWQETGRAVQHYNKLRIEITAEEIAKLAGVQLVKD